MAEISAREIFTYLNEQVRPQLMSLEASIRDAATSNQGVINSVTHSVEMINKILSSTPSDITLNSGEKVPNFKKFLDSLETITNQVTTSTRESIETLAQKKETLLNELRENAEVLKDAVTLNGKSAEVILNEATSSAELLNRTLENKITNRLNEALGEKTLVAATDEAVASKMTELRANLQSDIRNITSSTVGALNINDMIEHKVWDKGREIQSYVENQYLSNIFAVQAAAPIYKEHFNQPLMQKVNPTTVKIPRGSAVCGRLLSEDKILSLEENLQGAEKVAGSDYFLYFAEDFFLSADDTLDNARLLGGFHYSLVPHDEAPSGNKTEEDMVKLRGINAYSIWDLNYRPSCNPRAMAKCGGVWYDIYMADEDYGLNFYANPKGKFMGYDGHTTNYPKIPYHFGGNGTNTYGKLTWYIANELVGLAGKELPDYNHYPLAAYGVAENHYINNNNIYKPSHINYLMSKFGLELATGSRWIFSRNISAYPNGGSDYSITDNRGKVYSNSNYPSFWLLGGYYTYSNSGSRCVYTCGQYFYTVNSLYALRGCCKHQEH